MSRSYSFAILILDLYTPFLCEHIKCPLSFGLIFAVSLSMSSSKCTETTNQENYFESFLQTTNIYAHSIQTVESKIYGIMIIIFVKVDINHSGFCHCLFIDEFGGKCERNYFRFRINFTYILLNLFFGTECEHRLSRLIYQFCFCVIRAIRLFRALNAQ